MIRFRTKPPASLIIVQSIVGGNCGMTGSRRIILCIFKTIVAELMSAKRTSILNGSPSIFRGLLPSYFGFANTLNLAAMQSPWFYMPSVASANAIVVLDEDTSRHCVQVLRMKEGDRLQLINGKGSLYTAVIVNANKRGCSVRIEDVAYQKPEGRKVCIAISPLKNVSRFEWFLEKAVEMGVQEIVPLLCARTEKQHLKMERLQNIIISAMVQSRQVWLPNLQPPVMFDEVVADSHEFTQTLIAHCGDDEKKLLLPSVSIENSVQMLIGPEGDFTEKEIELALRKGYQPVSLGSTRLRTETAGVVASALLIYSHK